MIKSLLYSATMPMTEEWMKIPRVVFRSRGGWCPGHIILMDNMPDIEISGSGIFPEPNPQPRYLTRQIGELDFWNEWIGFAFVNRNIPVYDARTSEWEFPVYSHLLKPDKGYPVQNAGDRIVLKNGSVHIVYGFNLPSGRADIYFDGIE